jgi:HEAT repeat protein
VRRASIGRPTAVAQPPTSPAPAPAAPPSPTGQPSTVEQSTVEPPTPEPAPVAWTVRAALAIAELQASDPALYDKLLGLRPNRRVGDELFFAQKEIADPRAAAVLLKRLLNGDDSVRTRLAVVDALPSTGGDWYEGAAALIAVDADPRVRKKLVEVMRYVPWPHNIDGLRLAFADEAAAVRVAAARTTGFVRDGAGLYNELMNGTFDDDWDMRAACVQALGQLRATAARDRLVGMLADERPEVRLQVMLALDRVDPEGLRQLPALQRLARERDHWKVADMARRLLQDAQTRLPEGALATAAGASHSASP